MIKIRKAVQSDQDTWDCFVEKHPNNSPYHFFAWQQAIREAYKHESHYLIAEENNDVVGILPMIIFKKPFCQPNLCALPFCDVGGVLACNSDTEQLLLSEASVIAADYHANSIDHRASIINKDTENTFQKGDKVRMLMALPESSEILFSSFKSKLRSQVRKADKNGLHFKLGHEPALLDDFYDVFSHNMRALGSPVHSKQLFSSLLKSYKNKMLISVVYKDKLAVGAGIVLIIGNKASIPWASTKAEYNRLSPNMMLYWSFLEYLSDNHISEFDFGRSSYGEGTFKFKQQWGASPQALNWSNINVGDSYVTTESSNNKPNPLRAKVELIWRKLPLPVTLFFGPRIRKFISL